MGKKFIEKLKQVANGKGPGTLPHSSKLLKRFLKIIAPAYNYQLVKFGVLRFKRYIQKSTLFHVLILLMTSWIW